jgi:hypothetical protein
MFESTRKPGFMEDKKAANQGKRIFFFRQIRGGQPKSLDAEGAEGKRKGRYDTLCDLCETSASAS